MVAHRSRDSGSERLRVNVLGPLTVEAPAGRAELQAQSGQVLTALVLGQGDTVTFGRMSDLLWPEDDDFDVPARVHGAVRTLRRGLGAAGVLIESIRRHGYRLSSDASLDVTTFERDIAAAQDAWRAGSVDETEELLKRALGLWRGEPFAELADHIRVIPVITRLREQHLTAQLVLAEVWLAKNEVEQAVGHLRSLEAVHPEDERVVGLLMRALSRSGRGPEAGEVYDRFRLRYIDRGRDVSSELREIDAAIVQPGGTSAGLDLTLEPPVVDATGDRSGATGVTGPRPTGMVSFLFTDVEGSSSLWERSPDEMKVALRRHDLLLLSAIAERGGVVFSTAGDGYGAAFSTVEAAFEAATVSIAAFENEPWPTDVMLRVRLGIHVGAAEERDNNYYGPAVNRAARVMDAAHGGQLLLSDAAAALVERRGLCDLGEHHLRGLDLPERIWQYGNEDHPPLRTDDSAEESGAASDLPADFTTFVGRDEESAHVLAQLQRARLVSLVGIGGTGKTRLARHIARASSKLFPGGVEWIDLSHWDDVATAVGERLRLADSRPRSIVAAVRRVFAGQRVLVVLDNCEHLLRDLPVLIIPVLEACENLVILATTREDLEVPGEQLVRLAPLSSADASRLFVDRATAAGAILDIVDDAPDIRRICEIVDHLPLAIELVAPMAATIPLPQLAERAKADLTEGRLGRGTDGRGTLHDTLAWSVDRLGDSEREAFLAASAFGSGFTAEGLAAVVGADRPIDVLTDIDSLVRRSLIQPVADGSGIRRYAQLSTSRTFAFARLREVGRADEIRDRHLDYFVGLADALRTRSEDTATPDRLAVCRAEQAEFSAAADWGMRQKRTTDVLGIFDALQTDLHRLGMDDDLLLWLDEVSDNSGDSERAVALDVRNTLAFLRGRYAEATERSGLVLDAVRHLGDDLRLAKALIVAGACAAIGGDDDQALTMIGEAKQLAEAYHDPWVLGWSASFEGFVHDWVGDSTSARPCVETALQEFRRIGDLQGEVLPLFTLSFIEESEGDISAAMDAVDEGVSLAREIRDSVLESVGLLYQGQILFRAGRSEAALHALRAALDMVEVAPNDLVASSALEFLGMIAAQRGEIDTGLRLTGSAMAIRQDIPHPPARPALFDEVMELATQAGYDAAAGIAEGRTYGTSQARVLVAHLGG